MSREKGNIAEKMAREYLISCGFEIVTQNFYSKFGEIDIVALKDEVLHFVEVKSGENFNPIYAITPKKLQKIQKTIQYFLMQNKIDRQYCIDAICIQKDKINFLENIIF
ncbi:MULTISPECIES: YraN family protein [unclassified Helicobacter]|uniref:YraN family protein n=1 Tax=unclassified Helicobacter TaxID=2593540 RepID=UPI000CF1A78C|nr:MULTISPECIES: YraN family protein [unclassified Helicobacter]